MHFRLFAVAVALSLSGCLCGGGPPTGVCNGTWNGVTLKNAEIDSVSRFVRTKASCSAISVSNYGVSWGKAAVSLALTWNGSTSILSSKTFQIPLVATPGANLQIFPDLPGVTGSLALGFQFPGRRTGTLTLKNGAEEVVCTFNLENQSEGPSCGSSSGGGADFD